MTFKSDEIETLKDQLIYSIKKRFVYLLDSDLFKAITFLDNYYKNFEFISDSNIRSEYLSEAKKFLLELYERNKEGYSKKTTLEANTPDSSNECVTSMSDSNSSSNSSSTQINVFEILTQFNLTPVSINTGKLN